MLSAVSAQATKELLENKFMYFTIFIASIIAQFIYLTMSSIGHNFLITGTSFLQSLKLAIRACFSFEMFIFIVLLLLATVAATSMVFPDPHFAIAPSILFVLFILFAYGFWAIGVGGYSKSNRGLSRIKYLFYIIYKKLPLVIISMLVIFIIIILSFYLQEVQPLIGHAFNGIALLMIVGINNALIINFGTNNHNIS